MSVHWAGGCTSANGPESSAEMQEGSTAEAFLKQQIKVIAHTTPSPGAHRMPASRMINGVSLVLL
jgi:hypothetical protein